MPFSEVPRLVWFHYVTDEMLGVALSLSRRISNQIPFTVGSNKSTAVSQPAHLLISLLHIIYSTYILGPKIALYVLVLGRLDRLGCWY